MKNGREKLRSFLGLPSAIEDLSLAYTPGVARPCLEIQKDENKSFELTRRANIVAVVTDGTAVLGLGDIYLLQLCLLWKENVLCSKNSAE